MATAEPAKKEAPAPKKRLSKKTLGIVAGIAVIQGVAFFAVFKFVGGSPKAAHAEESPAIAAEPVDVPAVVAEVSLLKGFKVPNNKTGRMCLYDIDISVVVAADQKDRMKKIVEDRAGEIGDCVARIVRAATEEILREDDLRILRNQLNEGLMEIVDTKDLIQRILIPRFVPIPA